MADESVIHIAVGLEQLAKKHYKIRYDLIATRSIGNCAANITSNFAKVSMSTSNQLPLYFRMVLRSFETLK